MSTRIRIHRLEEVTKISVHHVEGECTEKLLYLECGLPSAALYLDDIAKLSLLETGWTGWNTPEAAASTTWRVKCQGLSLLLAGSH